LEHCGWKFWSVRGSEYYYNPEQALSSLWQTLDEYEIEPLGNSGSAVNIEEGIEKRPDVVELNT
jgi:hypothetical protein